jgi:hypothetical protein
MKDNKMLTFDCKAIMRFSELSTFDQVQNIFLHKVLVAGYKTGFTMNAESYAANPTSDRYIDLEDAALCYQHITKNVTVLG